MTKQYKVIDDNGKVYSTANSLLEAEKQKNHLISEACEMYEETDDYQKMKKWYKENIDILITEK